MSVLLSLPTELCHVVFDEWLVIKQWHLMDVAVCNKKLRIWLMEQFKLLSNSKSSTNEDTSYSDDDFLKYEWMAARGIKLKYLYVEDRLFTSKSVDEHLTLVENLEIFIDNKHRGRRVSDFINQCTNLKRLYVYCNEYVVINQEICSNLTSIVSYNSPCLDLFCVRDHCTKLTTFVYSYGCHRNYSVLIAIIQANPLLEVLEIAGLDNFISTIYRSCKRLKHLSLTSRDENLGDLGKFLTNCSTIEYVQVKPTVGTILYYGKSKELLCNYMNGNELITFFRNSSGFEIIKFEDVNRLSDELLNATVAQNAITLREIRIDCRILSAVTLRNLLLQCTQLIELAMSCIVFTCDEFRSIFCDEIPNKLVTLSLEEGTSMDIATMIHVLKACKHLEGGLFYVLPKDENEDTSELYELVATKVSISTGVKLQLDIEWCHVYEEFIIEEENDANEEEYYGEELMLVTELDNIQNFDDNSEDYDDSDEDYYDDQEELNIDFENINICNNTNIDHAKDVSSSVDNSNDEEYDSKEDTEK